MSNRKEDYEIGFGKPPMRHQFKPGQSGNPKGRPKGSRNLAVIFREVCNEKVNVKDSRGTRRIPKLEVVLTQLMNAATTGDLKATREILRLSQSLPEDPMSILRAPSIIVNLRQTEA